MDAPCSSIYLGVLTGVLRCARQPAPHGMHANARRHRADFGCSVVCAQHRVRAHATRIWQNHTALSRECAALDGGMLHVNLPAPRRTTLRVVLLEAKMSHLDGRRCCGGSVQVACVGRVSELLLQRLHAVMQQPVHAARQRVESGAASSARAPTCTRAQRLSNELKD